jgi:hypothetical protein
MVFCTTCDGIPLKFNTGIKNCRAVEAGENCWFLNEIASEKCCESCSQWSVHRKTWNKNHLRRREIERLALRTADVWVWVWVYNSMYSVQCKGYNLIGVTTVEASETRGTTALVYLQLHSSLYTGTVHVLSRVAGVHPAGLTATQRCRQVSTGPSV